MTTTFSIPNPRTNGKGFLPGMNAISLEDYGREVPFNNLMKQSRAFWVRNSNDTFDGTLDSDGYITDPGTAVSHNQVVVISASRAGMLPLGNYVLTWEGTGDCSLVSTGTMSIGSPTTSSNRKVYNVTDWGDDDLLYFRVPIASTDVTNVQLCHEDYEGTCGPGEANEFYQPYLDLYGQFIGGIRFMPFMATNQQAGNSSWSNRKPDSYRTYAHGPYDGGSGRHSPAGVPLSACVRIQNKLGIPAWYNIPHEYDDTSVEAFGQYLVDNVNEELLIAIEYSNETWNGGFSQNAYVQAQGLAEQAATGRFDDQNTSFPFWPWTAYRSTQCKRIIEPLFNTAGRGDRVCFVLGMQVGSNESKNALDCHVEVNYGVDAHEKPEDHHDSATIAFYWGNALLMEPQYSNNGAADNAAGSLRDGATKNTVNMSKEEVYQFFESLDTYESTLDGSTRWADWEARIVTQGGMEMLGYEGQHHVVTVGGVSGESWAQEIISWYEEERWGDVTLTMLRSALDNGFGTLMHFVAIQKSAPDGYWGLCPTYGDWDDIETYQRLRAVKHFCGLTNNRGV